MGLREIRTFITADALLTAVLLVWQQLWTRPTIDLWVKYYHPETNQVEEWFRPFNNSSSAGLLLTLSAVLLSLLALASAGWAGISRARSERQTPGLALGLFASSLLLGIVNVSQSLASVAIKFVTFNLGQTSQEIQSGTHMLQVFCVCRSWRRALSCWQSRLSPSRRRSVCTPRTRGLGAGGGHLSSEYPRSGSLHCGGPG